MTAKRLLLRATFGLALLSTAPSCSSDEPSNDDSDTGEETPEDPGPDSMGNLDGGKPGKSDAGGNVKLDGGTQRPVDDGGKVIGLDGSMVGVDGSVRPREYVNLAIQPTVPFDKTKPDPHPMAGYKPPAGWTWHKIDGAKCRDGSEFGVMAHWASTDAKKLFIYFEGGGACANPGFCNLNPADVNHQFNGKGQIAIASTSLVNVPQSPGADGIFNFNEASNPYKDYNFVYIPYCTGDVHFGGNAQGKIEGVTGTLNFSGAANSKAVIARTLATWPDATRFVAGGSSAGGYGAGLNFGIIQDSWPNADGAALLDASPPFSNEYAPSCLQKRWRESWNLDANLPSDCGEQCKSADGGNLFNIVDYWRGKYPKAHIALVSGIADEIIRLFFALGNDNCATYQTQDPVFSFIGSIGQTYDPAKFRAGLLDLRTRYESTGQLATYYEDGLPNGTIHQCLFDPRLYTEAAGPGKGTIAAFLTSFNANKMLQVGP